MASVTKTKTRNGEVRYRVRYRDPSGKDKEKWFRRKVDADRYARNTETDIDRGEWLDPAASRVTFRQASDRWLNTRSDKARSTLDRDRSYLSSLVLPVFGDRRLISIVPSEIGIWLAGLTKAPATRTKALQILRSVFDLARRDGLLLTNPAADLKPPPAGSVREGKALNEEELRRVIAAATKVDPTTAAMVVVMARCGLRVSEAIALHRDDVDLQRGVIKLRHSMSRREGLRPLKGRSTASDGRTISMPQDVEDILRQHLEDRRVANLSGFLFTSPTGRPIRYGNWLRRTWSKIVEASGVDAVPHDLRRTAATRLFTVDRWVPPEVQAYLGHRDPRITQKLYALVAAEDLPRPSALTETG